jgi:hypothetical protein
MQLLVLQQADILLDLGFRHSVSAKTILQHKYETHVPLCCHAV